MRNCDGRWPIRYQSIKTEPVVQAVRARIEQKPFRVGFVRQLEVPLEVHEPVQFHATLEPLKPTTIFAADSGADRVPSKRTFWPEQNRFGE
jgi:hypothetical protein